MLVSDVEWTSFRWFLIDTGSLRSVTLLCITKEDGGGACLLRDFTGDKDRQRACSKERPDGSESDERCEAQVEAISGWWESTGGAPFINGQRTTTVVAQYRKSTKFTHFFTFPRKICIFIKFVRRRHYIFPLSSLGRRLLVCPFPQPQNANVFILPTPESRPTAFPRARAGGGAVLAAATNPCPNLHSPARVASDRRASGSHSICRSRVLPWTFWSTPRRRPLRCRPRRGRQRRTEGIGHGSLTTPRTLTPKLVRRAFSFCFP